MPQNSLNSLFHGHIPPVREFNREMDQQTPSHTPTTNLSDLPISLFRLGVPFGEKPDIYPPGSRT